MPKTKIICTIGPKSRSPETLERLIRAGMNVARLNFSHGTQTEHGEVITSIRRITKHLGYPVAILQDLSGPKIRIGKIEEGAITLEPGEILTLTNRQVSGNKHEVSITYHDLPKEIQPGDTLLLSDGALELEVLETDNQNIKCRVTVGGPLSSNKGINLPTRSIRASSFTDKDRDDLAFGIERGVDYVALSFVRTASDIVEAKQFIQERESNVPVIAKIEKHEALENIDEIVEVVDGIMVARGDLGVEIPLEKVPLIQKMLIEKSNRAGKPVITATQMLRSMVDSPRPTRAEVTDVANAILDGTDAVMLSEETATGNYPVEAVGMMVKIAEDAESGFPHDLWIYRYKSQNIKTVPEAVSYAACGLAENINASSIVTFTYSGSTARLVSKYRPRPSILALTPLERTYRQLALTWGVTPIICEKMNSTDEMIEKAIKTALESGQAKRGERIVITAGLPLHVPGTTNLIKTEELD
jgi:pyruvate kinase